MRAVRGPLTQLCLLFAVFVGLTSLTGCDNSASPVPPAAAPAISSVSPTSVTAGAAAFTLTVNGSGFVSGATVQWNGSGRTTTFASATQLTAAILASDVTAAGSAQVTVTNPDSQKSSAATFTINAPLPLPTVASLSPTSAVAGGAAFTLTVNGTGFRTASQIAWNGTNISATTVVSATQLTASISASMIATAGTATVGVVNTDTNDRSGTLTFTITPATPTLTSLSANTAVAGSAALTLTVNGTGFVSGATVAWNGAARTTTFVSATQLAATIPATDLAASGSFSVDVAQSGVRSTNQLPFTVTPAPTLTSLSQTAVTAGAAAFTLTVNGTNFLSTATVAWNGSARTTTFVSSTQLTASITAADLATAGTASVDVVENGVHSANQLTFTVTPAPTLTSLSQNTATSGAAAFTLTVNGANFVSSATVAWNGSARTTTFVSSTQLMASITAADLATAGTATVDVVENGVRSSNQLTFTVSAPVPTITSLTPTGVASGSAATTLTITGTGFITSSVVKFNGSALTTNFVSSTQLTAQVPAAILASPATVSITVENPAGQGGASAPATFSITAAVSGKIVQIVSASYSSGSFSNSTNNNSRTTVSQDGRYVAFTSLSTDIVPADTNGQQDAFLRDTCVGSAPSGCTPTSTRISADPAGGFSGGVESLVVLSSDARYAGFDELARQRTDLHDNCIGATGCSPSFSYVPSLVASLGDAPNVPECCSVLSPDGRYIFFSAYYLYPSNNHVADGLYVQDMCTGATGCTPSTTRVAQGPQALPTTQPFLADISAGGRYVLFRAYGQEIIPTYKPGAIFHLFVEDTCIGAPAGCTTSYTVVDSRADGSESEGNLANDSLADEQPSFSKDGRYVVFSSTDQLMIAGVTAPHNSQVYVRDMCIGAPAGCVPTTTLVSAGNNGLPITTRAFIGFRSVSEHGRYVAYMLEGNDGTSTIETVRVRDTCIGAPAGCTPSTSLASADPDNVSQLTHLSFTLPSISADGHYVTFTSVLGNTAGVGQVYLAKTGY